MTAAVYTLTCITTLFCAVLLLRAFFHVRKRLLLWSGLCFVVLSVSKFLVVADLLLFPQLDLYTWRLATNALAMTLLLYGLIWESR